jgi:hypothetical protein
MKAKKLIFLSLAVFSLFLVLFVSINVSRRSPTKVFAGEIPKNLPTPTPYATSLPGLSTQILQKFSQSEVTTQTAQGVEMSATNFRLENNELLVDICYLLPSSADWIIRDAAVQIEGSMIRYHASTAIEISRTLESGMKRVTFYPSKSSDRVTQGSKDLESDSLPDYRCDTVSFRLEADLIPSDVTVVIRSIIAPPAEGEECISYRDNVQSILDAENSGIRLDCVKQEYGSITSIAEKSESMSDEEAQSLINEAKRKITTIDGPWIFTGSIE